MTVSTAPLIVLPPSSSASTFTLVLQKKKKNHTPPNRFIDYLRDGSLLLFFSFSFFGGKFLFLFLREEKYIVLPVPAICRCCPGEALIPQPTLEAAGEDEDVPDSTNWSSLFSSLMTSVKKEVIRSFIQGAGCMKECRLSPNLMM